MNKRDSQWLLHEKYDGRETADYQLDKERLASGEPLAYVIGWQPFLNLKIYLDSKPLIPRPETEWWTEQMLSTLANQTISFNFLDLCAGSGAIGCAALSFLKNAFLKKASLKNAHVYFGEIEAIHEKTILKNIVENNLDRACADIRIGNLFEPFENITFDLIAINPPYISNNARVSKSVTNYEPYVALFSGKDGLDLIRRIAADLPRYLNKEGSAWIECDSSTVEAARALFLVQDFQVEIRTDQYGKKRIMVVSYT